jgi:hypothetical protein
MIRFKLVYQLATVCHPGCCAGEENALPYQELVRGSAPILVSIPTEFSRPSLQQRIG